MEKEGMPKSKLSEREEEILKFWKENRIFEKSLEKPAPEGEFVFYEGPPTANGRPHIGHFEARAFKDAIPRYKTMRGYHVRRKGGWDTHGLPVELQVEKELGLKTKKEIEAYGIASFNKKCKESVWQYVDLWEKFTDRMGYWVDQDNPYITYKNYYIEAVWNILKHIETKGLLYKDYKVVPWCPRCETGLSSHELAQGYEEVRDSSVTVKFKVSGAKDTYILAWTTTPWTLPGNVALAVGRDIDYVKIKIGEEFLILAKARLSMIGDKYEIAEEMKGQDLVGLEYEPLFPYAEKFAPDSERAKLGNAFKVYPADFVTVEDGTGVVHTAVMYGQEDFGLGNQVGLPKIHTVNQDGTFKEGLDFLSGRFVKEKGENGKPTLDIDIFNYLKEKNLYFSDQAYAHSYPFCWRCHTPLIYYARDSWYVRMSDLREKLVKENEDINWIPAHIKEGRFGEWLREVKDWAVSRERYWGTPLPVWHNAAGEKVVIGSIAELKKYVKRSGNKYFLMRHGEAEQNIGDHINADFKNIFHLTAEGRRRAAIAAGDIKSKKIDLIVSSPFERCKQTAGIVAQALGLAETGIILDERIKELQPGEGYEGKTWSEYAAFFKNTEERFQRAPEGGETFVDLARRAGDFLYDLEKKYSGKNILIVTHEAVITSLHTVSRAAGLEEAVAMKQDPHFKSEFAEFAQLEFTPLPHNEDYELDLHRPYIDEIELVDQDGKPLVRTKEVMDVWFDSGGMPFAQDGLQPQRAQYPADFICEAVDQTRGWFYTLHAIGVLMDKGKAFKNVICLGHILDAKGVKMSKHLGNIVDPWDQIPKYGADALRLWMYTVNQPGDSKNFDEKTVDEVVKKVFNLAGNILSFYEIYRQKDVKPSNQSSHVLDRWILARLHELLSEGSRFLDEFKVFEAARLIRDFVSDFSTWYLRRSRERFKSEDVKDRNAALATTHFVLLSLSKYLAPFTPFFAEHLYLHLRSDTDPESVHLCDWIVAGKIEEEVLKNMEEVRKIVSLALEKRMAAGLKVRQPLNELRIKNHELSKKQEYLNLIKDEVNVKEISFDANLADEVELDTEITPELQREGQVREFVRAVQELRKSKNLMPQDIVSLSVETDEAGKQFLESAGPEIKKPTNIADFIFEPNNGQELAIGDWQLKIQIK